MLSEELKRDEFQISGRPFTVPLNIGSLDPVTKRRVTVSSLFANYQLAIPAILPVLDEKYDHVVNVLIERGLIRERRPNPQRVEIERIRSLFRKP